MHGNADLGAIAFGQVTYRIESITFYPVSFRYARRALCFARMINEQPFYLVANIKTKRSSSSPTSVILRNLLVEGWIGHGENLKKIL
jgi:hypothetical protein